MDLPTQNHLTTLRNLLEYRQHELRAEVHAAEQAQRGGDADVSHEVADQKDSATRSQIGEVDSAQEQRDLQELASVEAALRRLDEGRYGDCVDCGEPIALQRLMVQPDALRCAHCQTALEHRPSRIAH